MYLNVVRHFREVHLGAHILAVSFGETAHAPEWNDDGLPQLSQGILDGNGSCPTPFI